jgi:hypothetical protein
MLTDTKVLTQYGVSAVTERELADETLTNRLQFKAGRLQQEWRIIKYLEPSGDLLDIYIEWRDVPEVTD